MLMELTEHGQKLLSIIRAARGEWVTRSFIAEALERNKLYVWDTKLLDDMAAGGLIEVKKRDIHGPIGYEYQYRAKGQGDA